MKFLDSNVIVYSLLPVERKINSETIVKKEQARKIMERINGGEKVVTSVLNLAEVANILENRLEQKIVAEFISSLIIHPNIEVLGVSDQFYAAACDFSLETEIGVNDCLAYQMMQDLSINEVYTFDKDFDKFEGIRRIEK